MENEILSDFGKGFNLLIEDDLEFKTKQNFYRNQAEFKKSRNIIKELMDIKAKSLINPYNSSIWNKEMPGSAYCIYWRLLSLKNRMKYSIIEPLQFKGKTAFYYTLKLLSHNFCTPGTVNNIIKIFCNKKIIEKVPDEILLKNEEIIRRHINNKIMFQPTWCIIEEELEF